MGFSLTTKAGRARMISSADVVELVDSLDLGSNARACRFESCHPHHLPMESWIHGSIGIFVFKDRKTNLLIV